jgi:hypothetical protein
MKFERIRDLSSFYINDKNSYFYKFWNDFESEPLRIKAFTLLEEELQSIDNLSWIQLKEEASNLCLHHNVDRGWSKLFEKLNEVKGYQFLKTLECKDITFIPRSKNNGIETPDLEARLNDDFMLCEVKTINVSDGLLSAIKNMKVRDVRSTLPEGLKNKLKDVINKAQSQLSGCRDNATKFIYLVISFDEDLDHRNELNNDVRKLLNSIDLNNIEVVIHNE